MKFLAQDIDRRDWADLGAEGFKREYGAALRPVVVSGAIDHWGASGKWTPDFFRQNYGKRIVKIDGREWPLGELIDRIEASTPQQPAPYLRNELIDRWPAALRADIAPMPECTHPNWLESRAFPSRHPPTYVELYIGGRGAKFPVLHYDNLHTHAFLMQLYGEKEYLALAPDQAKFVYPRTGEESNKSGIDDLEHPDAARFPLFDQAERDPLQAFSGRDLVRAGGLVAYRAHPDDVDHRFDQRRERAELARVRARLLRRCRDRVAPEGGVVDAVHVHDGECALDVCGFMSDCFPGRSEMTTETIQRDKVGTWPGAGSRPFPAGGECDGLDRERYALPARRNRKPWR